MPALDLSAPIEISPRVWWVGSLIPGDAFQCHVYLLEQGDQSVLIDPGSALIVDEVIRKIDAVVGTDHVRWLVCSHADPDIVGALPALVAHGLHPDAAIATHWRDEALIVHTGTPLPFWRIEEHDWKLPLEDRTLDFVFTPYAHFAGAFCTFDPTSGTMFTSDLFGGFTHDEELVATSATYFESMRAFHEHYMPGREVLSHALTQLRRRPTRQIAPQHGKVIPEHLVDPISEQLEALDCGLYLLAQDDPGLAFLLAANRTIRDVVRSLVEEPEFATVASHVADLAQELLHAEHLELWAQTAGDALQFDEGDEFAGHTASAPADVRAALAGQAHTSGRRLVLPLRAPTSEEVGGAVVLEFATDPHLAGPTRALVDQVASLVEVGLEREVLRRVADLDRATLYEKATHDPLTGLCNRAHLAEVAARMCGADDRDEHGQLAALMLDIDHFKAVNDVHGHPVGDLVLQHVARAIAAAVRVGDLAARFGGEEFVVLLPGIGQLTACRAAERIRAAVADAPPGQPRVTASVGVALRSASEGFDALVARADAALYKAKRGGRDRIQIAATPPSHPDALVDG